MIAALGSGFRPAARRTSERRASWMRSRVPSASHLLAYLWTVVHGGRSWGSMRRERPARGADDFAQVGARSAAPIGRRERGFDDSPLSVGEVGIIRLAFGGDGCLGFHVGSLPACLSFIKHPLRCDCPGVHPSRKPKRSHPSDPKSAMPEGCGRLPFANFPKIAKSVRNAAGL